MVPRKRAEEVISTLSQGAKYLVIILVVGYLGCVALGVIDNVSQMNQLIIEETLAAAESDPNKGIASYGTYFAGNQGCYFASEDANGNVTCDQPVPASRMLATVVDADVDDHRYTFYASNSGVDVAILFTVVAYTVTVLILLSHMNNVISANEAIQMRFNIIKSTLSEAESDELKGLLGKRTFKKLFNYKACTIIPAIVTIASIIIVEMGITEYGLMLTDRISSVVQHYGVLQSESTIVNFNATDNISVYLIETPIYSGEAKIENTTLSLFNQDKVGVGYVTTGFMARNYKMLTNGKVLCVSINLKPYQGLVVAHITVFLIYIIYLLFRIRENNRIQIV